MSCSSPSQFSPHSRLHGLVFHDVQKICGPFHDPRLLPCKTVTGCFQPLDSSISAGVPAAGYLPPLEESGNSTGNLYFPLVPRKSLRLRTEFCFRFSTCRSLQRRSIHLKYHYASWKDTANAPILHPEENRDDSFRDVLHTVRPASMLARSDRVLTL